MFGSNMTQQVRLPFHADGAIRAMKIRLFTALVGNVSLQGALVPVHFITLGAFILAAIVQHGQPQKIRFVSLVIDLLAQYCNRMQKKISKSKNFFAPFLAESTFKFY